MKPRKFAHIGTTAVRTTGSILIILVGLVWEFSAKIQTFIGQITGQKLQEWLAAHISQIGPLVLIAGGIFWIALLHAWPALRRWFRPHPLAIRKLEVHNSLLNVVLYDQPALKSDASTST
jgi:hypothetical protein